MLLADRCILDRKEPCQQDSVAVAASAERNGYGQPLSVLPLLAAQEG
jgi:hypothetical protein